MFSPISFHVASLQIPRAADSPAAGHWYSALCLWEPFSQSLQRDAAAFEGQGGDGGGGQWPATLRGRCGNQTRRVMSLTPGTVVPYFLAFKSSDFIEFLYRKCTYIVVHF